VNKILDKLPIKGDFVKNTLTLTLGTTIAQVVPILFYPILGRIFTPEDFGLLATITSITAIIGVLATGHYERSILITETKQDAANVIGVVLTLSFVVLSVSFLVLQFLSNQFSIWFNAPTLNKWLFACPLIAFVVIIYNCYNEWCVRNKYFLNLSWNKIINAGATTLSKLFFGIAKATGNGLIVGDLIGRSISAFGCIYRALRKDKSVFFNISLKGMKLISKRFIEFPKYSLPASVFNTIGGQLPVMLIGFFFNSIEVGYFSMTVSVLLVPSSVISAAIRDTFRQRANEEYKRTGECRTILLKTVKLLSLAAIIGVLLLIFMLPAFFEFVLGGKWRISGEYAQILIPMIALSFISNSLGSVLVIAEKIKIVLFAQIYYFFIALVSLLLGSLVFHGIKMTLACFAVGMSSQYLLEIYLAFKYSRSKKLGCFRII
jgi:O-antigen/teichoic acid export membrane protein